MAPITLLTRQDEPFTWTTECNQAFTEIKKRYVNAPILIAVNWKLEFHIHTDASDIAVGAMLAQNPTGKIDQPIVYASRLLSRAEKNYTTTEREALAMVYAINKFRHYLLGNRFVFYVDHMALIYLVNKTQVSGRIARWLLLFLEFDFTVVYKPGKTHGIADALSRNTVAEPATGITDTTSDAQLFSILPEWLTTVHDYLKTGTFPADWSTERKKRLAYRALPFQLVDGTLYRQSKNFSLQKVITDNQTKLIIRELHHGNSGGHFSTEITTRKILDAGTGGHPSIKTFLNTVGAAMNVNA